MKVILRHILNYFRRLDKILILLVCAACALGICLLYSLVQNSATQSITNAAMDMGIIKTQAVAAMLGLGASLVIAAIDYRWFSKLWFIYLPATIGLTLLTFTSLGTSGLEGADDKAWIDLGFMTIQPAEFLKLAYILSLSYHCFRSKEFFNNPLNILALCVHGGLPIVLVMLQGDDGTAVVFMFIFLAIIFAAGISIKYILGAGIIAPFAFIIMWNYYLQPVHKNRILLIIDPGKYSNADLLYQTNHSLIALGSGQLRGKGLFGGEYSYVPACHNDFILSYAGQTLGYIGCLFIVLLLAVICLRILANGLRCADPLGKYICTGVFAYIITHCILNIGMVTGVTPVIGIPLPFLSAGGSAMLTVTVAMGLVLSVYFHSAKFDTLFGGRKRQNTSVG